MQRGKNKKRRKFIKKRIQVGSAIAEKALRGVGQFWPKVEDNILQTIYVNLQSLWRGLQNYRIRWNKAK